MHSHTTACWPCQLRTDVYCTKRWENNFSSFPHITVSAFSALTLLVGGRKSIRTVKNWVAWLSVWSEVQTCIRPSWCQCHSMSQCGFTFLVPAHLGSPGKRAIKWVRVCVCPHITVNPWKVLNETNGDYSSGRLYTVQLNKILEAHFWHTVNDFSAFHSIYFPTL